MELLLLSGIGWVVLLILGLYIVIAPILIWRNTGRTNSLLAAIAKQHGVSQDAIDKALGKVVHSKASTSTWEDLKEKPKKKEYDFE